MFFEEKKKYFQPVVKYLKQTDSLEQVFEHSIGSYINILETFLKNVDINRDKYLKIMNKIRNLLNKKNEIEKLKFNYQGNIWFVVFQQYLQ